MDEEELLLDLAVAWEMALENGQQLTPEEHCQAHPHLLERFRARLAQLGRIAPLCPGTPAQFDIRRWVEQEDARLRACPERVEAGACYELVGCHKAGGLGVVYRARDLSFDREVAVKFVRPDKRSQDTFRRFQRESEITGRLTHPGIVPVYCHRIPGPDGQPGEPFYTMRFIEGQTLRERVAAYH